MVFIVFHENVILLEIHRNATIPRNINIPLGISMVWNVFPCKIAKCMEIMKFHEIT